MRRVACAGRGTLIPVNPSCEKRLDLAGAAAFARLLTVCAFVLLLLGMRTRDIDKHGREPTYERLLCAGGSASWLIGRH
jgi:hypothetical protein